MDRLPRPDRIEPEMWVDEAIWGHRLYDEQTPWLTLLEFLGVVHSELQTGQAFIEAQPNTLQYQAYSRLFLRNILFNNPRIEAILEAGPDDETCWKRWLAAMKAESGGITPADFSYLLERFSTFREFVAVVKFLRSNSIEGDSNKRWSSKFVFPYGPHCLYEDLRVTNKGGATSDRRFFGRTGEILYLMICRSGKGPIIQEKLRQLIFKQTVKHALPAKWDQVVLALQPKGDVNAARKAVSSPYLPYSTLPEYEALAEDWIKLFDCEMPDYDVLPHLATITGLHLILYLLNRAQTTLGMPGKPTFILEILAPRRTTVRELAASSFSQNNSLSLQAVDAYVKGVTKLPEWTQSLIAYDSLSRTSQILQNHFCWPQDSDDHEGTGSPEALLKNLIHKVEARHKQHLGKCHSVWAREIGFSSRRGSRNVRYAPTDTFLKTIVLATVEYRMEFKDFLVLLKEKYGFIIGDAQAQDLIQEGSADQDAFSENALRLEQRLASIGLLKRLSDACAYVQNPFGLEEPS